MPDLILVLILLTILGGAAFYVYKTRKSGRKCIGCPNSGTCGKKDCCGCSEH